MKARVSRDEMKGIYPKSSGTPYGPPLKRGRGPGAEEERDPDPNKKPAAPLAPIP